jgi:hypothetical protein
MGPSGAAARRQTDSDGAGRHGRQTNTADQRSHSGNNSDRRATGVRSNLRHLHGPGPSSPAVLARAPFTASRITVFLLLQPDGRLRASAERRQGGHRLGRSRAAAQQAGATTPRVPRERLGQAGCGGSATGGGGAGIQPAPAGTVRHPRGPGLDGAAATTRASPAAQVSLCWSRPAGSSRARHRTRPAQPRPRTILNVPPADRHGALQVCLVTGLGEGDEPPTRAGGHPVGQKTENIARRGADARLRPKAHDVVCTLKLQNGEEEIRPPEGFFQPVESQGPRPPDGVASRGQRRGHVPQSGPPASLVPRTCAHLATTNKHR